MTSEGWGRSGQPRRRTETPGIAFSGHSTCSTRPANEDKTNVWTLPRGTDVRGRIDRDTGSHQHSQSGEGSPLGHKEFLPWQLAANRSRQADLGPRKRKIGNRYSSGF